MSSHLEQVQFPRHMDLALNNSLPKLGPIGELKQFLQGQLSQLANFDFKLFRDSWRES